jgi:SAM-dependent methyltransferase
MNNIDFGRHSQDYAVFRPGFPASFYRRIDAIVRIGETRSLDLATGPGTIALELADLGSTVLGIDISANQVATATRVSKERNLEGRVQFAVASAEETGLETGSFDLATAGQCWHWFDSHAVLVEMRRVLQPNGILVIAYYSYLAEHSPVARDSEDLILEFNPSWTMAAANGMYPERIDELIHAGYRLVEQFCYHHNEEFTHTRWRGRMRTCNGVGSGGLIPRSNDGRASRVVCSRKKSIVSQIAAEKAKLEPWRRRFLTIA